ncbi:MAG TPA: cytochrome c biogenesis protein CcdA [Patescibacteria group bacterium]
MDTIFFQTSILAAFVAGMIALFAPCCISFLLPAYIGTVFKEKEKVLLMTLIFGFGIFIVMLPAVLGVALLSKALFVYHDGLYIVGGFVMLIISAITFLGIKLPMVMIPGRATQKADPLSIFILGIFSGITSACCAPVLIGILTLTFLSPSFLGALGIGGVYVLGMITPLLIISLFLSGKADKFLFLKRSALQFDFLGKHRNLTFSNLIASIIFFTTGILILYLKAIGKLGMGDVSGFTHYINNAENYVNQYFGGNIIINILFLVLFGLFIYFVLREVKNK